MPIGSMPNTCTCLREARRAKGYQNFGQAGIATHRSPEAVGRHERGDVPLQMADAIEYADAYESPEILMAYCGECAIRKELFGEQEKRADSLPQIVIRVSNRLKMAGEHAETLTRIMDDGKVETEERNDLLSTLDFLQEIETTWRDLMTACMSIGLVRTKKDRPAGTGTARASLNAHHSI